MTDDEHTALEAERFQQRALQQHFEQYPAGGASLLQCEDCGSEIPQDRRRAVPGVRLCVDCKRVEELRGRIGR